jgi:hypothetical protein
MAHRLTPTAITKSVPITTVFSFVESEALRELAERESRTLSSMIRHLVRSGLAAEYAPDEA